MLEDVLTEKILRAADILRQSSYVVAFSGAGISTESGIPDFRSPECGLWNDVDPFEVASIYGFKRNPEAFYSWVQPLTHTTAHAQPNAAHYALVELEKLGLLKSVITQNIDMLHSRAGSSHVYELHGHMRTGTCIHCFRKVDGAVIVDHILNKPGIPRCSVCNEPIKPDVILFGEQLPIDELRGAQQEARKCDLMIVIGSSLEVAPAGDIPLLAKQSGAKLIIINLDATHVDRAADVVIHARAGEILSQIIRQLEKPI